MCDPATIALAAAAISGGTAAYGQYQQGQVAAKVGRNNQVMAEYAAQDAMRRGEEEAMQVRRRADQIKGAQRSRMAASGLDLGVGTAAELQDQTDFFGQIDQSTARDNAKREAWSNRAQGANANAQGQAAKQQANLSAFSTVLGTVGSVAAKWSQYGGTSNYNYNNDAAGHKFSASGADIRARR